MSPLERLCPALGTAALPRSSICVPPVHPLQVFFMHSKTQVMLGFQMEQLKHTHQEREPNTNNPGDKWGGGLKLHCPYPHSQRPASTGKIKHLWFLENSKFQWGWVSSSVLCPWPSLRGLLITTPGQSVGKLGALPQSGCVLTFVQPLWNTRSRASQKEHWHDHRTQHYQSWPCLQNNVLF